MPTIVPVSRERHANRRWKPYQSYAFASHSALVPLVAAEIPKAAMAMPLAFIRQGEGFVPAALVGLEVSASLFVARDGRWLGRYIPSALRSHPFSLVRSDSGNSILCVDEDSGLLIDGPEGEPMFTDGGEPSEALGRVLDFLQQIERSRVQTESACGVLDRHGLVRPWPIMIKGGDGEHKVEGVFQVDESALNQLSDEAFLDLRRSGALPMAYCQMLSIQHLGLLGELAKARVSNQRPPAVSAGFALPEDGLLQFDWDRLGSS